MDDLKEEMAALGKANDGERVTDLENELRLLKQDYSKFKDDVGNSFKVMNDLLNKKVDKQDLIDLENRLIDKLNEMLKNLFN